MTLGLDAAKRLLPEGVRFSKRPDGTLVLRTRFSFSDGDRLPIHVSKTEAGQFRLSDRGHTVMHASYDHDADALSRAPAEKRLEGVLREAGVERHRGVLHIATRPEDLPGAVLRLGEAAIKIFKLTSAR